MIKTILSAAVLKNNSMSEYYWSFNLTALLLSIIGVSIGIDPANAVWLPSPLWGALFGIVFAWTTYPVITLTLRWWLKRGNRWNGEGPLFNVVVAASAITIPIGILTFLGVPPLLLLPLWLYSIWVAANALEGACGVSLSYAVAGVLLSILPAIVVAALVSGVMGVLLAVTGTAPLLPGMMPSITPP